MPERAAPGPRPKPLHGAKTCPDCGKANTKQTKTIHEEVKTIRPRICMDCGKKFRTVEEHGVYLGWVRGSQS